MRPKKRIGWGYKSLIDEQDNIIGDIDRDRINSRQRKLISMRATPNDVYWIYRDIPGQRAISMLSLRYVEYMDTPFIIKPFKRD
jgi:hypothetical protein